MKRFQNIVNYLKYTPKKLAFLWSILVLVVVPMATMAGWAPNRPIKDWNKPADRTGFNHVAFNSFINTPNYGNERAFYDVKDASNKSPGGFKDQINVKDGQTLLLRTYIHNGANPSLNASGKGIAKGAKVRILVPTGTDRALRSISYVSADNAKPGVVSDTADFVNAKPFRLDYVEGSAKAITNAVPKGYKVSDSIVNGGAPVGYTGPNGRIPGCFQYDMLVSIKVKVKVADFNIEKKVRKEGTKDWKENVTVEPGDKVEYLIDFENKSDADLRSVVIGDKLPNHVTYVNGSSILYTDKNPSGKATNDNLTTGGIGIGHYSPGAGAYIKFTAKVTEDVEVLECGANVLTNKAVAQPENMKGKEDTAKVTVNKECIPPVTPPGDTPDTPGKPSPVGELPNTGPATAALGAMGSGAMGIGIRNYLRSRKSLLNTLLDK